MSPEFASPMISERFQILGSARQGGMGAVYRAIDHHTGKPVAIKLINPGGGSAQDYHRFSREAQLLAQLHHPHIVAYVAHGYSEEGCPYLAMDWLDGEDLSERLRKEALTLSESLHLLRTVAGALSVAHSRGVIHRDFSG